MNLLPGTEVTARGVQWQLVSIQELGEPHRLLRLRGNSGALAGQEIELIHPFEDVQPIVRELRPDRAAPLVNWMVYVQAFLLDQLYGPNTLSTTQPGRLRIEPYQLVPVLRALRSSRVRILLADGVGLGKTVQAGLLMTELLARRAAHRILITCPAGPLLDQWQEEMLERFSLRFEVIDRQLIEEKRRETELGSNPFNFVPLALASLDFLKQERMLEYLERTTYDVVVIDEAHHCMNTGQPDREDSQRRRLAETLARRSDALILSTATPHNGHDPSFASLCELLDPSLVDGRGVIRGERFRPYVVRRLKHHIRDQRTGLPMFKERVVKPVKVVADPVSESSYRDLHQALYALVAPELRRAFRARRYDDVLAFYALLKRSVSTAAACQETLAAVQERFNTILSDTMEEQDAKRQRLRTLRDYRKRLERFGTLSSEEEAEIGLLEREDLAQKLADLHREVDKGQRNVTRTSGIVGALDELLNLAEEARTNDPKLRQLLAEVRSIRTTEPAANILIYTEYTDSLVAAVEALREADFAVITMSGGLDDRKRAAVTDQFREVDGLVLVSTDAAAEGLNLHQRCHHLIHLELPFNPNRLEQRNGRIDRYGQTLDPIVSYLYLQGTFEERILLKLIAKFEKQRRLLRHVPNTLGLSLSSEKSHEALMKGLIEQEANLFKADDSLISFDPAVEDDPSDPATQELLEEIDRSMKDFDRAAKSAVWLGDAGLHADARAIDDASKASAEGEKASGVDIADFVIRAVRLDHGTVRGKAADPWFEVVVPGQWALNLTGMPGFDADERVVRVTTSIEVMHDDKKRPVGFLGRSHPLVQRALERMRNLALGSHAERTQDVRASVVAGPVTRPCLMFVYVGRVMSRAGRELERLFAVKVAQDGTTAVIREATEWLHYADLEKALRTTEVFERHFQPWFEDARHRADGEATKASQALADEDLKMRRVEMQREDAQNRDWLTQRADEVTSRAGDTEVQEDLFAAHAAANTPSTWKSIQDPLTRLAAFAADRKQSPKLKSEAETVVSLFKRRHEDLQARMELNAPEAILIAMLMILPEDSHGA